MPELVAAPTLVPVPGGKQIEEYVGRVTTSTDSVSVARMHSPPGWSEPVQAPAFDEVTLVLSGGLKVTHAGGVLDVGPGQAVLARAGERVQYSTPEGADYVAVCVPAFGPELAHREG